MSTILLFPGQGSQYVGMGKALSEADSDVRVLFEEANSVLGYDLAKLCFEGPEEELKLTQNTQPAILTVSIAAFRFLQKTKPVEFSFVAGHSLGEYSALVAAGSIQFSDAVKLVNLRGQFMQEAVPAGVGAMAALMGGENAAIENLCSQASEATGKVCEMANYNGGGQLVISGHKEAVEWAVAKASEDKSLGVRKAVPLPVSAPFHCSLMRPAADKLASFLDSTEITAPSVPYIANVDAKLYDSADGIRTRLSDQIAGAVRWQQSMEQLAGLGVDKAYELGPGKVLMGLMRRIDRNIKCTPVETPENIEAL